MLKLFSARAALAAALVLATVPASGAERNGSRWRTQRMSLAPPAADSPLSATRTPSP